MSIAMAQSRAFTPYEICQVQDPVLRNLQITVSYNDISNQFSAWLGGPNVNWCSFATWASKQAGKFIRKEQIPRPFLRFLGIGCLDDDSCAPSNAVGRLLRRSRFREYLGCTLEDVSAHIAAGNLKVYRELAPIFTRFLQTFAGDSKPDQDKLDRFLQEMRPYSGIEGSKERLSKAFRWYYNARFEADRVECAQLIFGANCLVGLNEQIHLQKDIADALGSPFDVAFDDPQRTLIALPLSAPLRGVGKHLFKRFGAPLIEEFEREWLHTATEFMMTLALPDGELDLGDDLPPLPDGRVFPEALEKLTNAEVKAILYDWDVTRDTLEGSAARNWADLADRMNYIVDLFRSRQQRTGLLAPAFTEAQIAAIRDGHVPRGRL